MIHKRRSDNPGKVVVIFEIPSTIPLPTLVAAVARL
jgi:hypothetical protein